MDESRVNTTPPDDLDRRLILLLQANARESTATLARKLGVARTTVVARLARLEASRRIVGYTSRLGGDEAGRSVQAFVGITVSPKAGREVVKRLTAKRGVDGRRVGKPTENVTITNCTVAHAHGAVVIGSGFGGLAAAVRLGARGYRVTVLEKLDAPGGRAYVFRDKGFIFDGGPTIVTAPFLLDKAERNIVLGGFQAGWGLRRLLVIKIVAATIGGFLSFSFFLLRTWFLLL